MEINRIYNESCLDTMNRLPDSSVDLVVTSPPYEYEKDGLRKYDSNTGLGWTKSVFEECVKSLYRVIKDGGVVVWNVADKVKEELKLIPQKKKHKIRIFTPIPRNTKKRR